MNNYIPFNKAIGPKVLCDGYEALIPQKLGVDEMTFTFDGGSCEHASCAGAPEMFIKVEEEALYHLAWKLMILVNFSLESSAYVTNRLLKNTDVWNWLLENSI